MGSAVLLGGLHAPGRVEMKKQVTRSGIGESLKAMRRTVISVIALSGAMFPSISIAVAGEPVPTMQEAVNPISAAQSRQDARELVPGVTVAQEIAGGEAYWYRITLASGQYLRAAVGQPGVNVVVKLFGPEGQLLTEVNNCDVGEAESISLVAEVSGEYRVEVRPIKKDAAGRYEVKIEELRGAIPQDRSRVAAERAIAEGQLLRWQETAESRRGAIKKYEESLPLWRAAGDIRGEAEALTNISSVSHELGENRKALDSGEQALPLWRAAGDRRGEAFAHNMLGLARWVLNEYQKALEDFNQALALNRATGNLKGEGVILTNIGNIYSSLSEYQKALEHYGQAHSLRRATGDRWGEATTLNNMGVAYNSLGEYQKALECYDQALPLRRAVGNRRGEAYTLANIGDLYEVLGEYQKAMEYHDQSLLLGRAVGDRSLEAHLLNSIGRVSDALGYYQKALEHYSQALALFRDMSNQRGESNTLSDIGSVHQKLGDYQKASDYHNQALSIRRAIGHRGGEALSLNNIGLVSSALGESQKALENFNQALALQRAVVNRKGEALTLFAIARVERNRGNLVEARARMEAALDNIESLRTKVTGQELRASFLASVRDFYDFQVDLLARLHERQPSAGHDAAALVASERGRARSLLETLGEARADIRQGVDPGLLERERSLHQQINANSERLTRLLGGKHTEEQALAAKKELDSLVREYQQLQAQIRTTSPRYAALTQPVPLSLKEIQQQVLDNDTLLLEYALGEERSYLWAVTPTSITSFVLPKRAEIETAARRAYDLLMTSHKRESKRQAELAASDLSRMVLGPVAEQLGKKRLLIVSEGALQYIPFGALPAPIGDTEKGGRGDTATNNTSTDLRVPASPRPRVSSVPLVVTHEIVNLPSASVLAVLRRELTGRQVAPKTLAVFADPIFQSDDPRVKRAEVKTEMESGQPSTKSQHGRLSESDLTRSARESGLMTFERLRFTRQEADTIVAQARDRDSLKALDFAASRATVTTTDLDQYRIVHFATHSLLNSQHPELSGIVLSLVNEQGRPQDGFLRAHDIYNLKLGAELVVLSACQTALGKEIKGEGLAGLTRGFMYAGAERVVASLWDVKDEATAELMKRFYRGMLREGLRPAEALREAQISMWKEPRWGAPYYWAGFTLQGEWR